MFWDHPCILSAYAVLSAIADKKAYRPIRLSIDSQRATRSRDRIRAVVVVVFLLSFERDDRLGLTSSPRPVIIWNSLVASVVFGIEVLPRMLDRLQRAYRILDSETRNFVLANEKTKTQEATDE